MGEADLDRVAEIEKQEPSPWKDTAIRSELLLKNAIQLVGLVDTKVIGWICSRYRDNEAELLKIAVADNYRREGVATRLLECLIRQLTHHGVNELFLEVRSQNYGALQFYRNRGFTEIGRRTNYYKRPQDNALILKMNNF